MQRPPSAALTPVLTFVPKLPAFLAIKIIGYLIANAIDKLVSKLVTRVGFDRVVERGGIKKALESSKFAASDIIAKVIYYALLLFVLQRAFVVFGPNPISDVLTRIIAFLPALVVAIIVVIIAGGGGGLIKPMQQRWEQYPSKAEHEAPKIEQQAANAPA